jgi:hypothetical protein
MVRGKLQDFQETYTPAVEVEVEVAVVQEIRMH